MVVGSSPTSGATQRFQIAHYLGISLGATKKHVSKLFELLGASRRAEMVERANQFWPSRSDEASAAGGVLTAPAFSSDAMPDRPVSATGPQGLQDVQASQHLATIAILPFEVVGGAEIANVLAYGLFEDLVTRLGHDWFPVIDVRSAHQLADSAQLEGIADRLGARYIVRGAVRPHGGHYRLTVRLLLVASAKVVWSELFEVDPSDLFGVHDRIVAVILFHVSRTVVRLEHEDFRNERTDFHSSAVQCALRAMSLLQDGRLSSYQEARMLSARAVEMQPQLRLGLCSSAQCHQYAVARQWTDDVRLEIDGLRQVSSELLSLYPRNSWALLYGAYAHTYVGQREQAIELLKSALLSHPSLAAAHRLMGQLLAMGNEPDAGIAHMRKAALLSPLDPDAWAVSCGTALCHFVAERYFEALPFASRAVQLAPHIGITHGTLAACAVELGDLTTARGAIEAMGKVAGGFRTTHLRVMAAATEPKILQRFLNSIEAAGRRR